ncbi:MAG: hypothetical protein K2X82_07805 [Gemmataceae bacterium]|nr:hypothetical protein [Gemmataceae bacterium]
MSRSAFPVRAFALALALCMTTAGPAAAADPGSPPGPAPLFAGYWGEFVDHWVGKLRQQNGVVMAALGVGAVALVIITRGKWLK